MIFLKSSGPTFNDERLSRRFEELLSLMSEGQSNVIPQLSKSKSASKAYYRFYQNKRVTFSEMIGHIVSPLRKIASDRHVLVLGDSTQISLHSQLSDIRDSDRIGVLSDNKTAGFHAHVHLAMDASSGHGLGVSDLLLWNRQPSSLSRKEKDRLKNSRKWSEKESYKWNLGLGKSLEVLDSAQRVTYVFDAEADLANLWKVILDHPVEAVIRLSHNRPLVASPEGGASHEAPTHIKSYVQSLSCVKQYELELRSLSRRNYSRNQAQIRQARKAKMEIKFGKLKPKVLADQPTDLYIVQAKEDPSTVPQGEEPVNWMLLTTHKVEDIQMAEQIIFWYSCRWMIEQLFRLIKKQGFQIEATELEYFDSILKQTLATFAAAFRVMQLLLARDKPQSQPIEEVFTTEERRCLKALNQAYQGKTKKLQNPYPEDRLSWATWIIGRLGGWKGYKKARPPGPIILKRGLQKFYAIFEGWNIARSEEDMGEP